MNSPQKFGTLLKRTFCLILLFGQEYCYAQSGSSKIQLGVFFMSGNSLGINPSSSPINNQVNDYRNGFVQAGLYTFIKFKPDSASSVFKYLRVDLGLASRTGTFDVGSGNLARLTSSSVDLVVICLCVNIKVCVQKKPMRQWLIKSRRHSRWKAIA